MCVRGGERLLNLDNSSRYDRRGNQLAVCPIGNGELVSITDQPEAKCTGQVTINLFLTPPTPAHTDTHTHARTHTHNRVYRKFCMPISYACLKRYGGISSP